MTDINYDTLFFRPYLVPVAVVDAVIIPGPCIIDSIFTTNQPSATWTYVLFDGITPGGTQIWAGLQRAVASGPGLRIRCFQGLYLQQSLGVPNGQWLITAAAIPGDV